MDLQACLPVLWLIEKIYSCFHIIFGYIICCLLMLLFTLFCYFSQTSCLWYLGSIVYLYWAIFVLWSYIYRVWWVGSGWDLMASFFSFHQTTYSGYFWFALLFDLWTTLVALFELILLFLEPFVTTWYAGVLLSPESDLGPILWLQFSIYSSACCIAYLRSFLVCLILSLWSKPIITLGVTSLYVLSPKKITLIFLPTSLTYIKVYRFALSTTKICFKWLLIGL